MARPSAQGQAIIKTDISIFRLKPKSELYQNQKIELMAPSKHTVGTNIYDILSTIF